MAQPVVEDEVLSLQNPVFRAYLFYCCVLVLKMMFMSILTGITRFKTKAFVNPEDIKGVKGAKLKADDNVERVRRAHLNDLENIPIFFAVAFVYVLTNPSVVLATNLFRIFTIARIVHTFVYAVVVIPQPARAASWFVAYGIVGYMALRSLIFFL